MMTNAVPNFQFLNSPIPLSSVFSPASTSVSASTSSSAEKRHFRNPRKKRSKFITPDSDLLSKTKKPNPDKPMITAPCTECGRRFYSQKALFGHMRCHPERQWRGIIPPPNYRRNHPPLVKVNDPFPLNMITINEIEAPMTEDEHEVAASLLLLVTVNPEEPFIRDGVTAAQEFRSGTNSSFRVGFECSGCKKVFGSHQALGGHRASHKNVKGCFAITRSDGEVGVEDHVYNKESIASVDEWSSGLNPMDEENKMMMVLGGHKCSICLRVFSSGQALGGHKRCHWEKGESNEPSSSSLTQTHFPLAKDGYYGLDLNLPAPMEDDDAFSCYSSALTLNLRLGL